MARASTYPWMSKTLGGCQPFLRHKIKYLNKEISHLASVLFTELIFLQKHLHERPNSQSSNMSQISKSIKEVSGVTSTQGNLFFFMPSRKREFRYMAKKDQKVIEHIDLIIFRFGPVVGRICDSTARILLTLRGIIPRSSIIRAK